MDIQTTEPIVGDQKNNEKSKSGGLAKPVKVKIKKYESLWSGVSLNRSMQIIMIVGQLVVIVVVGEW